MKVRFGVGAATVLFSAAMIGCGGSEKPATQAATSSAAPSAAAAPAAASTATYAAPTGKTWEVKMLGDAQGYRFEPKDLTIKVGDAVKFIMVSGGPHDVTFWGDSIPTGAMAQLNANMQGHTADLTAPMTINPNDSYTVSFANVPDGTYHYYCTPHLAMGMVAKIEVTK